MPTHSSKHKHVLSNMPKLFSSQSYLDNSPNINTCCQNYLDTSPHMHICCQTCLDKTSTYPLWMTPRHLGKPSLSAKAVAMEAACLRQR